MLRGDLPDLTSLDPRSQVLTRKRQTPDWVSPDDTCDPELTIEPTTIFSADALQGPASA
jgi:hypothetical protein